MCMYTPPHRRSPRHGTHRLDEARRRVGTHDPQKHLAAMQQFAAVWQPSVLLLHHLPASSDGVGGSASSCAPLQQFAASLAHVELGSPATTLVGLSSLPLLTCLSLRRCPNLTTQALLALLQGLPQVRGVRGAAPCYAPGAHATRRACCAATTGAPPCLRAPTCMPACPAGGAGCGRRRRRHRRAGARPGNAHAARGAVPQPHARH
jgi:hypothetical protein